MIRLIAAARRRNRPEDNDAGFALIFVMLVTMLITLGTATMLAVTASNILPAKHSQDTEAATAAAEAGIQAYVAKLNANCSAPASTTCTFADLPQTTTAGGVATYAVHVIGQVGSEVRIASTGTSPATGSNTSSRTLVADLSGALSPLRYAYFSDYETNSGQFVADYLPAASIPVSASSDAGQALELSRSVTATWPGISAAQAAACDEHYYDGRSGAYVGSDAVGNPLTFTESFHDTSGQFDPPIPSVQGSCEVMFSDGMSFAGPVYSQDAMLLSKGTDRGTGPTFGAHAMCASGQIPTATTPCETLYPASSAWAGDGTRYYRQIQPSGYAPTDPTNTLVAHSPANLSLPPTDSDAAAQSGVITCSGPTDITLGNPITLPSNCSAPKADPTASPAPTIYIKSGGTPGTTNVPCNESGLASGITQYATDAGDACVHGSLGSGALSIVAAHDVIVTGDVKTSATPAQQPNIYGEQHWGSGAALDLVAQNDVVVYHPVTCADLKPAIPNGTGIDSPWYAYCDNDITGLYSSDGAGAVVNPPNAKTGTPGALLDGHPARQYCNAGGPNAYPCAGGTSSTCSYAASDPTSPARTIQAAVFALNGSLLTDNYNRGCALGTLSVTGGVYEHHRGAVGEEWETASGLTQRSYSGYKLAINYLSYLGAGLPYVPALQAGTASSPWVVLAISSEATP